MNFFHSLRWKKYRIIIQYIYISIYKETIGRLTDPELNFSKIGACRFEIVIGRSLLDPKERANWIEIRYPQRRNKLMAVKAGG